MQRPCWYAGNAPVRSQDRGLDGALKSPTTSVVPGLVLNAVMTESLLASEDDLVWEITFGTTRADAGADED